VPDPMDVLRGPDPAVEPRPEFSARLRARIERALTLPQGVTVSALNLDLTLPDRPASPDDRELPPAIVPYLAVAGARDAIAFYRLAFGATVDGEPYVMGDGRIGHAELVVAGARLMLSDEHPEIGVVAPRPGAGATVTLHLTVRDVDAAVDAAVAAGADLERPAADHDYGRNATLRDPFGHRWMLSGARSDASTPGRSTPGRSTVGSDTVGSDTVGSDTVGSDTVGSDTVGSDTVEAGIAEGEIGYVSLWVPDAERAGDFFADVVGWRYEPADDPSRQVVGQSLRHGVMGGVDPATLMCCFAVADVDAAIGRVLDAGGSADEPVDAPYGRGVSCTDDQGVAFALYTPPEGTLPPRTAPTPDYRPGDLVYVTMQVVDSARTRAFYGTVLGWEFTRGGVSDGWVLRSAPHRIGVSGGHERATVVPQYAVADIAAAVARVRALGGEASDPDVRPYGTSSLASDPQGVRFYLTQL
jgi:predicted enzyme related to lactoylglutathione lyase